MINNVSNYADHLDRPIAPTLAYVPLNDLLTRILTTTDPEIHGDEQHPVDYSRTHWDFATSQWVIIYLDDVEQHDPLTVAQELKAEKIAEVTTKLSIPDLSLSAKGKLENYLAELNSLELTVETIRDIVWPTLPF